MNQVWTSRNVRIWYRRPEDDEDAFWIAGACQVASLEYMSKAGTCSYCGHDVTPGQECPGCAARKSNDESLIAGKAKVSLSGLMPHSTWMFRVPNRIELHIRDCGRADNFVNWIARMIMTNIQVSRQSIDLGAPDYDAVIMALMGFTCDFKMEERDE